MRILVSNDDGYHARGLNVLVGELAEVADVTVVAPDRNRSGASNSLTLDAPLRVRKPREGVYTVNGTPTDCVHLAITGLLEHDMDMVVSGINHGANLGDDVLYSGTVAAAMEGRFMGLPAIAISLTGDRPQYFDTAARVATDLIRRIGVMPLAADTILNVNVPNRPYEEVRGLQVTRLGHRHKAEQVIRQTDPRNLPIYWIGPSGPEADCGPGTDFHAIREGFVSVTPLTVDLTGYEQLETIGQWLERSSD